MRWTEAQVREHLKKMSNSEHLKKSVESPRVSSRTISEEGITFTIPLSPVTKKNHNNLIDYGKECPMCKRKQYSKVLPSNQFSKYKEELEPFMFLLKTKVGFIDYPINLKCLFYCDVRRKSDLVGYMQSIQDIMADYGVISDDNRDIIASIDGSRVLYDKNNPRTEITITRMSNYDTWAQNN